MAVNIPMEKRDKIYAELDKFLKEKIGDNGYALIFVYAAGEIEGDSGKGLRTDLMSHTLTNLNEHSPLVSWQGILSSLAEEFNKLSDQYGLPEPK